MYCCKSFFMMIHENYELARGWRHFKFWYVPCLFYFSILLSAISDEINLSLFTVCIYDIRRGAIQYSIIDRFVLRFLEMMDWFFA